MQQFSTVLIVQLLLDLKTSKQSQYDVKQLNLIE